LQSFWSGLLLQLAQRPDSLADILMATFQDCLEFFLDRHVRIGKFLGMLDDLAFDLSFSPRQGKKPRQLVILDACTADAKVPLLEETTLTSYGEEREEVTNDCC